MQLGKLNHVKKGTFDSASGLKPLSAYVVVGVVLSVAIAKLFLISQGGALAEEFRATRLEERAPEDYRIVDRTGRLLAASVPSYDLLLSPQVMWQNHTPARISAKLASALDQDAAWAEALEREMLPTGPDGWRRVDAWEFGPKEAGRVQDWIRSNELHGWSVEADEDLPQTWRLWWEPRRVLSETERLRHFEKSGPAKWTRFLTRGLWKARHVAVRKGLSKVAYDGELAGKEVWEALLPEVHNVPITRITPNAAMRVETELAREYVARAHMRLERRADREHPAGDFPTLGAWGFTKDGQETPAAFVGLELAAEELASPEALPWLQTTQAQYKWVANRVSGHGAAPYFNSSSASAAPIVVETTIDLALQRRTHDVLLDVMDEFDPVLAMAIVVDVASGEVLALDAISEFPTRSFLPVAHLFSPGSTFKMVTMAMGLDAGVVDPTSDSMGVGRFDVGHGQDWRIPAEFGKREIDEADGAPTGVQSLANCLAFSINAGMVQVGLKLSPEYFRGRLVELGYGQKPGAGLGGENFMPLPSLPGDNKRGQRAWRISQEQASISFGHNISVSLWQHAEALSTVLRDGVWRPMTMVRAVSQADRREPIGSERGAPRRVFREGVGPVVRDMMTLGARVGTGRKIVRDDIDMGTKTGTTWKEEKVLSTRIEMRVLADHMRKGDVLTNAQWRAERRALRDAHIGDARQYTSSVIAVGHLPGADTGREIMTLVVVDEPRNAKFGSQVAGPAAVGLLAESLGLTVSGEPKQVAKIDGFRQMDGDVGSLQAARAPELPWMDVLEASR